MGKLINGKWSTQWYGSDSKGHFIRDDTHFRNWIKADGSTIFTPEADRYHLYASWACPWAHRTLIMRQLKQLTPIISLSVVDYLMGEDGWTFSDRPGCIPDMLNHATYLREIYVKAKADYTGRVTVPVLWDKQTKSIVSNESRDIMRMFDIEFSHDTVNFYPQEMAEQIDKTIDDLYTPINNGVYRAGFATTQAAYDEAVTILFNTLDHWETILTHQRYLCGEIITEADWCFFTTLLRFDLVYYGHFKCNIRHIYEYPNIWNYLKELYQIPGVAETCDFDHIKNHYYQSHETINPQGIVPKGPYLNFQAPHDRTRFTTSKT